MEDRFEDPRHIKWAKLVKQRDNFTCQICNATNTYLNSHHKNSYDFFESQRFDVNNGITLCSKHHRLFHDLYGYSMNTEFQFIEFKKITKIIKYIVKYDRSAELIELLNLRRKIR